MIAGVINGELIAPMTYEETMISDFFEAWFQKSLLPTVNKKSVFIMDNIRFHRMLLCEELGHKLLPLPPYTPEYNPNEKNMGSFVLFLFQLTIEQNPIYKSKNYHSTVVVINFSDYHKGKIETKARFLGMRLAFLRVCCRPLLLQQEFLSRSLFILRPINDFLNPIGLSLVRHLVILLSYPHQTAPSQRESQYLLTNH